MEHTDPNIEYALQVYLTYQEALDKNIFTDPVIKEQVKQEAEKWREIYLTLTEDDTSLVLTEFGLKKIF